ncbi:MAG: GNAT family N-acetyltransferase [Pseudolysinimonas sp.]|uniref:GNAT family N-acetyltransferase n=1 Tax=Pseudolysinimonas sp. TaxID=2680009 RepID=UPI003266E368
MSNLTIEELPLPASVDSPEGADFVRAIEVGNAVEALSFGTPDLAYAPDEELSDFHNPHQPRRMWLARVDGVVVGSATVDWLRDDDATAWVTCLVLPDFRRRGIGTALADAVEGVAREAGRRNAISYVASVGQDGDRLPSPTGFGSVPREHGDTRFALARGFKLEQVERVSRLALPVDGLADRLAAAEERSGPDYRVHRWIGRTPERFIDDAAFINTRMSIDAPTAGLDEPEDVWTAERLVTEELRTERTSPRRRMTVVVEHLPSGHLVGKSVLSLPPQTSRAVQQYMTLVLREYRGHGLGMLLKLANLAYLEEASPGHPSVITFNAEENRPMLDTNEALGFVPIASEGAWQKVL